MLKLIFTLPGRLAYKVVDFFNGHYGRETDQYTQSQRSIDETPARIGLVTRFNAWVSDLYFNHQKAINLAFWGSLLLAGAAALTLFLWPAALAAVTTFAVAGFSIAGLVGTGLAAQLGVVAGLTAVATGLTVLALDVVYSIGRMCCSKKASNQRHPERHPVGGENDADFTSSSTKMGPLGGPVARTETIAQAPAPAVRSLNTTTPVVEANEVEEAANTFSAAM